MRPRVIHTIETAEPGGAEKILVQVAHGLRDEFEPTGVVLQQGWTSGELEKLDIPVVHFPLVRSFDISWVRRMVRYIREHDISLIHAHEFTSNSYSVIAARITNTPIICTVHGKNYYPDRYYRRFAYRRVAGLADEFIAVSNDLKEFVCGHINIPPARISVVHNGIDTRVFDNRLHDHKAARGKLDIPSSAYVIIVVAALFEMKGHKDLITALAGMAREKPDLFVLFVGDGDYRQELQKLAAESGLREVIRFLGFRSDIPEMLSVSDLFVLPSYSEGLPVSVLEAMAAGVPVIATDVGGLREVVRDGENAYLVPPAVPSVLAGKITFCMSNRTVTKCIADQARKDVVESFDIKTMLSSYRNLYWRLLKR